MLIAASWVFTAAMIVLLYAIVEGPSVYDWFLFGMHGLALALLWRPVDRRWLLGFAVAQPLVFPLAWIAAPLLVLGELVAAIRHTGVFEDFSEPPLGLAAQVVWLLTMALCVWMGWRTPSSETERTLATLTE